MDQESLFIHETAVVDQGAILGEGVKVWHFSHLMPRCIIGAGSIIGQNCFVANHVILGIGVKVQNNVSLYEGIHCEDYVFIGPSAVFTNVINPRSAIERKDQFRKTLIKKGASIGANATIICGNTIGTFALIGAGTVVTKEVPDFALVVGNPSRQIGWVSEAGHRLDFDSSGQAFCPETGTRYTINDKIVVKA